MGTHALRFFFCGNLCFLLSHFSESWETHSSLMFVRSKRAKLELYSFYMKQPSRKRVGPVRLTKEEKRLYSERFGLQAPASKFSNAPWSNTRSKGIFTTARYVLVVLLVLRVLLSIQSKFFYPVFRPHLVSFYQRFNATQSPFGSWKSPITSGMDFGSLFEHVECI